MSNGGWVPLSTSPFRSPPAPGLAPLAPAPPPAQDIRIGENGYVHGVEGMLDQVARAFMKNAGPMLRAEVLPVLQQDQAMQTRVGQAVGAEIAQRWRPWLIAGVGALTALTLVELLRYQGERSARQRRSP